MNNYKEGLFDTRDEYLPLAQWLQLILAINPQDLESELAAVPDNADLITGASHMKFYRQLPDFAQALLTDPTRDDILRFGPLVFHLIACPTCHTAYLEIYAAMSATIGIEDGQPFTGQLPYAAANNSTRALVYTSQLLIQQAADVMREDRHQHKNQDTFARSLLQQAIYLSSQISQSTQRQRALQDLVDVATMFDNEGGPAPAAHSYIPVLSGSSASQKTTRRLTDTPGRPDGQVVLRLQTKISKLEGTITQNQDVLELHLENLDQDLRGRFLLISVPCGSIVEPVRWLGGNPRAIKSAVPVSEDGSLSTPLGSTELQLNNQEEYNLLEAMFIILHVRPAD